MIRSMPSGVTTWSALGMEMTKLKAEMVMTSSSEVEAMMNFEAEEALIKLMEGQVMTLLLVMTQTTSLTGQRATTESLEEAVETSATIQRPTKRVKQSVRDLRFV